MYRHVVPVDYSESRGRQSINIQMLQEMGILDEAVNHQDDECVLLDDVVEWPIPFVMMKAEDVNDATQNAVFKATECYFEDDAGDCAGAGKKVDVEDRADVEDSAVAEGRVNSGDRANSGDQVDVEDRADAEGRANSGDRVDANDRGDAGECAESDNSDDVVSCDDIVKMPIPFILIKEESTERDSKAKGINTDDAGTSQSGVPNTIECVCTDGGEDVEIIGVDEIQNWPMPFILVKPETTAAEVGNVDNKQSVDDEFSGSTGYILASHELKGKLYTGRVYEVEGKKLFLPLNLVSELKKRTCADDIHQGIGFLCILIMHFIRGKNGNLNEKKVSRRTV